MATYKLTYFDGRGRGEIIRYIFAVAGVEYEDIRVEHDPAKLDDWTRIKPTTIFGQLPVIEFDGRMFCQSLTIARYLARKYNLAGKTDLEELRADMIVDCIDDVVKQIAAVVFYESDEAKKAEKTKKFLEVDLPTHLANLEKILKENNNGDGYFVGNNLTWADLTLSILNGYFGFFGAKFDGHPKLEALLKHVETQPRLAAWLVKRPVTKF